MPTDIPTDVPTDIPTDTPTDLPTDTPTDVPSDMPTDSPSDTPTDVPTSSPTPCFYDVCTTQPTENISCALVGTPNASQTAVFVIDGDCECRSIALTLSNLILHCDDGNISSYNELPIQC